LVAAYYDQGDRLSVATQTASNAIATASETSKAGLATAIGNRAARTSSLRSAGYKVFDIMMTDSNGGRKLLNSDEDIVMEADKVANILTAARQIVRKELKSDMHALIAEQLAAAAAALNK
jgi:hypothetical protein